LNAIRLIKIKRKEKGQEKRKRGIQGKRREGNKNFVD